MIMQDRPHQTKDNAYSIVQALKNLASSVKGLVQPQCYVDSDNYEQKRLKRTKKIGLQASEILLLY